VPKLIARRGPGRVSSSRRDAGFRGRQLNVPTDRPHGRGEGIAVFLAALGAAWSVGNVGAVVTDLGREFELSLATVGLLSGTLLLGVSVPGTFLAPLIAERFTIVRTLIAAAVLGAVGNLVFAVAPGVGGLVAGRAIAGFGLGLAVVTGPVFARATGGVERVGLFGAAIQLGIAGGLAVGAVLTDLDVDWRLSFWLSAVVAASPLPFLIGREGPGFERKGGGGFVRLALSSSRVWRLAALFLAVFAVPLILGSWLVHYLSVDNGLAVATAGALSFVMFGVSAAGREAGGRLAERGVSPALLVGAAPFLAAAGLAILALDDSLGFAAVAVVAAGIGFALPYGPGIVQAQRLYPREPAEPVALVSLVGTLTPVPFVPLIGSLLDDGYGTEVFLAMAAVVAVGGFLNLRPVEGSLEPEGQPPTN
jgi:predicted MFS family arabinose efflux permease